MEVWEVWNGGLGGVKWRSGRVQLASRPAVPALISTQVVRHGGYHPGYTLLHAGPAVPP